MLGTAVPVYALRGSEIILRDLPEGLELVARVTDDPEVEKLHACVVEANREAAPVKAVFAREERGWVYYTAFIEPWTPAARQAAFAARLKARDRFPQANIYFETAPIAELDRVEKNAVVLFLREGAR